MSLPTEHEIIQLHKKHAPSKDVFELVFTHCGIVANIADHLIDSCDVAVDASLVRVGCLLHGIGVYPLYDIDGKQRTDVHYITHGIRGEEILKAEGYPEVIWRFASHHTGTGLTVKDITTQNLPLPLHDFEAKTSEEMLVMYADKFHSKSEPPHFNSFDWYRSYISKFGGDKAQMFESMAQQFGIPNLDPLVRTYGHQMR